MHPDAMYSYSPMMLLRKYGLNKLQKNSESIGSNEHHTQGQLNYVNYLYLFLKQTKSTLPWPSKHYGCSNFYSLPYLSNQSPFLTGNVRQVSVLLISGYEMQSHLTKIFFFFFKYINLYVIQYYKKKIKQVTYIKQSAVFC